MNEFKLEKLFIERLIKNTESNKIRWSVKGVRDNRYTLSTKTCNIVVQNIEHNIILTLMNDEGTLMHALGEPDHNLKGSGHNTARTLYNAIRTQYYEVHKLLNDLIVELKE